jgi:RNA polymerase sigma-70 factor (ECF subfamily)
MNEDARRALEGAYRQEWARVVATTIRTVRDLDLAEEAVQDAFADAIVAWERDGVPRNPGAWLTTTAKRRALDSLRRASTYRMKLPLLIEPEPAVGDSIASEVTERNGGDGVVDDTMRLVCMCCHPSLSSEAQMALTLRLVCGMTTPDIARCFLVSERTMAARLTRAKKKIAIARIPFQVPRADELSDRLGTVLGVIYLLFTIGHTAPTGETLIQRETVDEALRLAHLLYELEPDHRDTAGLLALLLVNDARRESRQSEDGRARRISDQDRSTWDHEAILEAERLIAANVRMGHSDRYTLQAQIAMEHVKAPTFEGVDWQEIVRLYDELVIAWPSPVVQLNRAVALSKTSGAELALQVIDGLENDGRLHQYQYLPAVKAYLLDQLGRSVEAAVARSRAFELAANEVERKFLLSQFR